MGSVDMYYRITIHLADISTVLWWSAHTAQTLNIKFKDTSLCTHRPSSTGVVNPSWLFTIRWTLPPIEKFGVLLRANISVTIPWADIAASPWTCTSKAYSINTLLSAINFGCAYLRNLFIFSVRHGAMWEQSSSSLPHGYWVSCFQMGGIRQHGNMELASIELQINRIDYKSTINNCI